MGITLESILGMCYADHNGVDFRKIVMIGRQSVLMDKKEVYDILKDYDNDSFDKIKNVKDYNYAEWIFKYFGGEIIDSIDYNSFERATIIHDMNTPISNDLKNKYSLVWDGGTLEHVFNYPIAIKNCMDMVKVGGHLILETPGNNFFGHGFYQFSPELFFSLLNKQNGFEDTKIFMKDDAFNWYEVIPPQVNKRRTEFSCANHSLTNMFVISNKVDDVPDDLVVLQSDYIDSWEKENELKYSLNFLKSFYKKIPNFSKPLFFSLYHKYNYYKNLKKYYIPRKDFSNPKK